MEIIIKLIIITIILVGGICLITIPIAFMLMWLDDKGIIKKITNIFRREK